MSGVGAGRKATGLIVALDHPELDEAERLAKTLSGEGVAFKVGLTLFAGHGPEAVLRIGEHGRVFCDLKLHDIPFQVASAAAQIAGLGVWMLSVHASGGTAMIRQAAKSVADPPVPPILAAVTVLTSLSAAGLEEIGQGNRPGDQVLRLATLAVEAGAGAIVCSPHELPVLRSAVGGRALLITPGVRPGGAGNIDQARVMTPGEAAQAGADHIVVGRPITGADEPLEETRRILLELEAKPAGAG